MKHALLAACAALAPGQALAETTIIDTAGLPNQAVYETAQLTPLALSQQAGTPAVVLLRVPAGDEVPPHTAETALRLLTVIEGEMSWGDGESIDPEAETIDSPGSVLVLPLGVPHWLAARNGDV